MIKKIFQTTNIFAAAILFFVGVSVCSAQMVGNFRPAEAASQDVKNAADFAVGAENAKRDAAAAFKLRSIAKAEQQLVAGMNYRMCLEVESGGEKEQATAVVYRNLQNKYSLTSWEGGNCASGSKTAPEAEETEDSSTFNGKLEVGKTRSTILYLGEESGDYAAFCFLNNSEAGRKILAACKAGEQCEFTGKVDYESPCKVPGLEASLSASGKIMSVTKVKSLTKRRPATTKKVSAVIVAPDAIVVNLYAAQKAEKGPFFQTKSRESVDQYFNKEIADLIWKDAVDSNGEVGALEADPLYNVQDREIRLFKIGKPEYGEGNGELADVPVTFKNMGKAETILFRLEQTADKSWKISDIFYPSNEEGTSSLKAILSQ